MHGVQGKKNQKTMKETFRKVSNKISNAAGSALTFILALTVILTWAISGPMFGFSDTWQLIINTGTTIVTFLMVFLIQNTQNRDAKAMHLKLDELIRSTKTARNAFVDLENFTDEDLELLDREFKEAREELKDNASIRRLRKTIAAEKERRMTIKSAGAAIANLAKNPLSMLTPNNDEKKADKK